MSSSSIMRPSLTEPMTRPVKGFTQKPSLSFASKTDSVRFGQSENKKPWKWGIFSGLMLLMATGVSSIYRAADQQLENCGPYAFHCPQMEDSAVPEFVRDLGSGMLDSWRQGDAMEKGLVALMGLLFSALPIGGAYALGHYVQQKRELKDFMARFDKAKRRGGDTLNRLAHQGLRNENPMIRSAVLTGAHNLPMTNKEKAACYLLLLRDENDTVYKLAQEAVKEFVKQEGPNRDDELLRLLGQLHAESPGFYKEQTTIYQKIGNVTVPQTITTYYRHEYSSAYEQAEKELLAVISPEWERLKHQR